MGLPGRAPLTYEADPGKAARGAFVRGEHPDAAAFEARVSDLYDAALWRADQTLAGALERLRAEGLLPGARLIVTSDHGELLGEGGGLGHEGSLDEAVSRVPLVVSGAALPAGPVSATRVYDLALGADAPPRPAAAVSWPSQPQKNFSKGRRGASREAAIWAGHEKLHWRGDAWTLWDLTATPPAASPLGEHRLRPALESIAAAAGAPGLAPALDADQVEALRAAGYME